MLIIGILILIIQFGFLFYFFLRMQKMRKNIKEMEEIVEKMVEESAVQSHLDPESVKRLLLQNKIPDWKDFLESNRDIFKNF